MESAVGSQPSMHQTMESAVGSQRWEWDIDPVTLRRMAQTVLELFVQPQRWIHRRVERVYFKDHQLAHHQISVDFTLPTGVPPIGKFADEDIFVAPLFLLVKDSPKPLREGPPPARRQLPFGQRRPEGSGRRIPTAPYSNIDLTDQHGDTLSLLTRSQSGLLAGTMLLEAAERILGRRPEERLTKQLLAIASRSWPDLAKVLDWLLVDPLPSSACDSRSVLRRDEAFTELLYTLASHSVVICLFMHGPPGRSVYKLSYDEPANDNISRPKGRIWRSLGWQPEQYFVSLNEIGASSSYHAEIAVPGELEIIAVNLFGKRYSRYADLLKEDQRDYAIQQVGVTNEGKIYIREPLSGRRVGMAWVKLRARRSGFLGGALLASWLTTALLALGAYGAPLVVHGGKTDAATAALLLAPALLAAYIARPGEHAITRKMLRSARLILLGNATVAALAVFFLIITSEESASEQVADATLGPLSLSLNLATRVGHAGSELRLEWAILFGFSLICSLLLTVSNIAPRPRDETVYEPMPSEREDPELGDVRQDDECDRDSPDGQV